MSVEDSWYTIDKATGKKVKTKRHSRGQRWRVRNRGAKTVSFHKKSDAEDHDVQVRGQLHQGIAPIDPTAGRTLFRTYTDQWFPKQNYAPSSASTNQGYLKNHLNPFFGDMQLGHIASTAHSTLTAWLAYMRKKPNPRSTTGRPYSDSTIELVYILLSTILKAAWKDKKIPCDPCADVPYPKAAPPAKVQAWEPEMIHRLLDETPDPFHALVQATASCGHRQAESFAIAVENIRPGHIDIVHQALRVNGQLALVPPKHDSAGTAPLAAVTAESLALHLQRYPTLSMPCQCPRADHEGKQWRLLFHDALPGYTTGPRQHPKGRPLLAATFNEQIWHPALRAVDLDPADSDRTGMHMLRHFAASAWLSNGAQPHEVQQWLRHKSFKTTTDIYGHLFPSGNERGRTIMDNLFSKRQPGGLREVSSA